MARPTGTAHLPLHGGRVPLWLAERMERLARVVVEAIVLAHGRDELLARLAHPFWFQAFGAVMGMDWHSSGITTTVLGALKRATEPLSDELGLWVCGGRGKHSLRTPDELRSVGEKSGLDGERLARTSRLVAKVDGAAVQDGFDIYLHGFVVGADGTWVVVQQGMRPDVHLARRYHWHSTGVSDFFASPHTGIEGENEGEIVNLADTRASHSRSVQIAMVERGPETIMEALVRARRAALQPALPHLEMPARHHVTSRDVNPARLSATLAAVARRAPEDFAELLLTPGVGMRTVRALALVAELLHGAQSRFADPARFSIAHGGKDGEPFPVPLRVYDETLRVLRDAITRAKLGHGDRMSALARLDEEARRVDAVAGGASFDELVRTERAASRWLGGRTAHGTLGPRPRGSPPRRGKLRLDVEHSGSE